MIWNKETTEMRIAENFSCIYILFNLNNGKTYVGKAEKCYDRLRYYYYALKNGNHVNSELQNDFNAGDSFEVKIICKFEHEFSNKREELALETFFIIGYNAVEKGYNKSYNYNNRKCADRAVLNNIEYICQKIVT